MLPAFKGPLISWKRTTVFVNYQLTFLRNDTDGAFAIPATGDLNAEWGPAVNDVRHRANIAVQQSDRAERARRPGRQRDFGRCLHPADRRRRQPRRHLQRSPLQVSAATRCVRPARPTSICSSRISWRSAGRRRCLRASASLAAAPRRRFGPWISSGGRYRVQFYIQGQNLTNQPNYLGYSGTMSSPFSGRPTAVREMRRRSTRALV